MRSCPAASVAPGRGDRRGSVRRSVYRRRNRRRTLSCPSTAVAAAQPNLGRRRPLDPLEQLGDYRLRGDSARDTQRRGHVDRPSQGSGGRRGYGNAGATRDVGQRQPAHMHRVAQFGTEGDATVHALQNRLPTRSVGHKPSGSVRRGGRRLAELDRPGQRLRRSSKPTHTSLVPLCVWGQARTKRADRGEVPQRGVRAAGGWRAGAGDEQRRAGRPRREARPALGRLPAPGAPGATAGVRSQLGPLPRPRSRSAVGPSIPPGSRLTWCHTVPPNRCV